MIGVIGLGDNLGDNLAALNATLNATSAVLITAGWWAITRQRQSTRHKTLMLAALGVSSVFLVSYLVRLAISGVHKYPGDGLLKATYLAVLGSHVLLAMATVPLVLGAVWHAWKQRFDAHKKFVKYALPIWLYVSVTGVIVYVMLYQALPAAPPVG